MGSPLVYRYAASVDDILEEEEHYADQLKEYLFYTDALRYLLHWDFFCRPSTYHYINQGCQTWFELKHLKYFFFGGGGGKLNILYND